MSARPRGRGSCRAGTRAQRLSRSFALPINARFEAKKLLGERGQAMRTSQNAFATRGRRMILAGMLCGLLPAMALAQDVTIRGRVRNAEGKAIKFAAVAVRDAEGTKISA